jgi:NADP-dependent 3-hydroxy acid dehydrogenase YdfG
MTNHIEGKSIVITGAGSGFGKLASEKAAALGGLITCADIDLDAAEGVASAIRSGNGTAIAVKTDVREIADMRTLAAKAVEAHGGIDVMVNNAGIMPLAFWSDHDAALEAWNRCIDINLRGIMNGIAAVHDQMIAQGHGHVVNVASIYGNFPVAGAGIYGATKAAVGFLSESLRVESRGKIKVTTVRPTGVPSTGLSATIVNQAATVGILGQNEGAFLEMVGQIGDGSIAPERLDPENMEYASLAPEHIADAIIHAINQPWGVSISDMTIRAAGDHFIL